MGVVALADALIDFGSRSRPAVEPIAAPHLSVVPEPVPPAPNIDEIVAKAVAEAEAAVASRFEIEMETRLAEQREQHKADLDQARAEAGVELGGRLMESLSTFESAAIEAATTVAARILGQVATEAIASRSVAALAVCIRDAIADSETVKVRVKGPQTLFLPLAAAMGEQVRYIEFTEQATTDLTVMIDETLFTTRLAEWSSALSEVIR